MQSAISAALRSILFVKVAGESISSPSGPYTHRLKGTFAFHVHDTYICMSMRNNTIFNDMYVCTVVCAEIHYLQSK